MVDVIPKNKWAARAITLTALKSLIAAADFGIHPTNPFRNQSISKFELPAAKRLPGAKALFPRCTCLGEVAEAGIGDALQWVSHNCGIAETSSRVVKPDRSEGRLELERVRGWLTTVGSFKPDVNQDLG